MLRGIVLSTGMVLLLTSPCVTQAQGVVPGGWAPQFGYQVMVGPGAVGYGAGASFGVGVPGSTFGYGYSGYGGLSSYGTPYGYSGYPGVAGFGSLPVSNGMTFGPDLNQTVNGMNPLVQSIRRATRTRRGR